MAALGFTRESEDVWRRDDISVRRFYMGARGWRAYCQAKGGWLRDKRHAARAFSNAEAAAKAAVETWL